MTLPVPATATSASPVSPDTVISVARSPVNLAVPPDGRINNYGVTAMVTGVATGAKLGGDTAGRGQQLWAVGLAYQVDHNKGLRPAPTPTATLIHDNTRIPLPRLTETSGTSHYIASVPAKAPDVVLELASAGYAQDFSLTNMGREGPQPAVLYRDATSWQTTQPLSAQATLPVPAAAGLNLDYGYTLNSLTLTFTASATRLSWFGPDTPGNQPINPAKGWLTLNLRQSETETDNNCPNGCAQIGLQPTLTANQIVLSLPGAPPEPATLLNAGTGPSGSILNGIYAWQIPATTSAGTVTIAPGGVTLTQPNSPYTFPLAVPGAASLAFTLPAPAPPATPLGAATKPAHYPQTNTGPGSTGGFLTTSGSSSDAGPIARGIGGGTAAIAAVVIAVVVARRRRQPTTAAPAPQAPPADSFWPATNADRPPHPSPQTPATAPPSTGAPQNGPPPATSPPPQDGADSPPEPVDEPAVPPTGVPLRVSVLGPVQIEGWAKRPGRRAATDIITYLACHPDRPATTDRLRAAVGAGSAKDPDEKTLRSYLSHTRRVLGAHRLPDASDRTGYRLQDVECDWVRFQQLTATAEQEPDRAENLLSEALALVRGQPFADGCAWAETELLPETIGTSIAKTGTALAKLTIETKPDEAERAASIGLTVHPTDEQLSLLALKAAAKLGHLQAAWQQTQARWCDLPLPAALTACHDRLATGRSRPTPR